MAVEQRLNKSAPADIRPHAEALATAFDQFSGAVVLEGCVSPPIPEGLWPGLLESQPEPGDPARASRRNVAEQVHRKFIALLPLPLGRAWSLARQACFGIQRPQDRTLLESLCIVLPLSAAESSEADEEVAVTLHPNVTATVGSAEGLSKVKVVLEVVLQTDLMACITRGGTRSQVAAFIELLRGLDALGCHVDMPCPSSGEALHPYEASSFPSQSHVPEHLRVRGAQLSVRGDGASSGVVGLVPGQLTHFRECRGDVWAGTDEAVRVPASSASSRRPPAAWLAVTKLVPRTDARQLPPVVNTTIGNLMVGAAAVLLPTTLAAALPRWCLHECRAVWSPLSEALRLEYSTTTGSALELPPVLHLGDVEGAEQSAGHDGYSSSGALLRLTMRSGYCITLCFWAPELLKSVNAALSQLNHGAQELDELPQLQAAGLLPDSRRTRSRLDSEQSGTETSKWALLLCGQLVLGCQYAEGQAYCTCVRAWSTSLFRGAWDSVPRVEKLLHGQLTNSNELVLSHTAWEGGAAQCIPTIAFAAVQPTEGQDPAVFLAALERALARGPGFGRRLAAPLPPPPDARRRRSLSAWLPMFLALSAAWDRLHPFSCTD